MNLLNLFGKLRHFVARKALLTITNWSSLQMSLKVYSKDIYVVNEIRSYSKCWVPRCEQIFR
jgi:hypothetical protein